MCRCEPVIDGKAFNVAQYRSPVARNRDRSGAIPATSFTSTVGFHHF
jgi:hypothetical protein